MEKNLFVNHDFETGDLTGWIYSTGVTVAGAYKRSGSYGCRIIGGGKNIRQTFSELPTKAKMGKFGYWVRSGSAGSGVVLCQTTIIYENPLETETLNHWIDNVWEYVDLKSLMTGITGVKEVQILTQNGTSGHWYDDFYLIIYPPIEGTFSFIINEVDLSDECILSAHYIKSHPNPDPDTFEIRVLPECGEKISFFDAVEIKKEGVTEFYGFVEEITPEVGEDGLEYLISGRCWKLIAWKKWNERFQESREVGPEDTEGNIETGFFGAVKPEELVKFIMRCPISEHPKDKIRHKIGWGIASDYWDCCANVTADCHYPEWVALRYTGLAWRSRGGADTTYYDTLPVNSFDSTYLDWDEIGASPYLDSDTVTNRIELPNTTNNRDTEGDFGFTDLGADKDGIYLAYLNVKLYSRNITYPIRIYLYDGTSWHDIGLLEHPYFGSYGISRHNVSNILDTVAKVNIAKIRFVAEKYKRFPTVRITYAYLDIVSYKFAEEVYQFANDYFIVDMSETYDDVTAMLIECRNNPNMYARNYKIQHTSLSNCCNDDDGANPVAESDWNDFTPPINVVDNEVRDILHSWEPEDDIRCIRIKLTLSACNSWEISQIYVWQADEHKYRLMDEGD